MDGGGARRRSGLGEVTGGRGAGGEGEGRGLLVRGRGSGGERRRVPSDGGDQAERGRSAEGGGGGGGGGDDGGVRSGESCVV